MHNTDSMDNLADKYKSICGGMTADEEAQCIKKSQTLSIKPSAEKDCDYRYQYQNNNCINNKVKQKKQLEQSLEKHLK